MTDNISNHDVKSIAKYAGAYIAWVIGSGFATGQEILRFFTSYGYYSYAMAAINLVGFLIIGKTIMITGYNNRENSYFRQFEYYCGKKIGKFYSCTTPVILFLLMSVLFSAAGATLNEYYGINHYIGACIMAGLVLFTYLIGFERFVQIVSKVGPIVMAFFLVVGIISIFRDWNNFFLVPQYVDALAVAQASPNWLLTSVLYLSLMFLTGGTYYTNLGASADSMKSAKWGAIIGSLVIFTAILILNTAILINGNDAASLAIPTLYLAEKISVVFAGGFSVILIMGMFSACSGTMWSVCGGIFPTNKRKNKTAAVIIAVSALIIGLLPFTKLVSIFFPLIGYYGLFYIFCIIYKGVKKSPISGDSLPSVNKGTHK